ncbi:MAG: hypothetical protein EP299_01810 [Acidobacteria bacterium]|nr:MAG: hypothetical protein EP299_01810 [Acidobacteriota bacterium]
MDVYCRICGEPWDLYTFHDIAAEQGISYNEATANFRKRGCRSTGWGHSHCVPMPKEDDGELTQAQKAGILYELLGDDMDGAAAMMEDLA